MSTWNRQVPIAVSLRRLFPGASFVGCADIRVTDASESSNQCRPDCLFAAIEGTQTSGINFVDDAIERGATALLLQKPLANVAVSQCIVRDSRRAYARLCSALAGHPSCRLNVLGVTGTNGKTTVTWLIRSILQAAGKQTGLLGTVEYHDGVEVADADLTTPNSKPLFTWLAKMVRRGTTHVAMELSSHALDQNRADGLTLHSVVVTNVTQDHFDYHGDFQTYLAAKANILALCRSGGQVVLNADDHGSQKLFDQVPVDSNLCTFGIDQEADVSAKILDETHSGCRFELCIDGNRHEVLTPLIGRHNVSNCLAAAAATYHAGVPLETIVAGIGALKSVPGRLERIDCGQSFQAYVDYAHTDDALRRCVLHLRHLTPGRLFCVFGAGGDRDKLKRPLLGKAAAEADVSVVTSDNPRSEEPEKIMRDILVGFAADKPRPHFEPDREQAIRWAIDHAAPGDCVLIAGKGHEVEQIIGTQRLPFDDREVTRTALRDLARPASTSLDRIGA